MVVMWTLFHLFDCHLHPALHFVFCVGAAAAEAGFELFDGWRHYEDGAHIAFEQGIVLRGLAHLRGALHIDVEQQIGACGELVLYLAFEGAVKVAVDVGVFVKIAGFDLGFKTVVVEEVVIDGVDFAAARLAGGGCDDAFDLWQLFEHAVAEGGFPAAGGAGYDDEEAGVHFEISRSTRRLVGAVHKR